MLTRCSGCGAYCLSNVCRKCGGVCVDVVYKFKFLKDAPKDSAKHFDKKRRKNN